MSFRQEILNEIENMIKKEKLHEVLPVLAVAGGIASVPVLAIGATIKLLKAKLQDDPRYATILSKIPGASDTKSAAAAIASIVYDTTGVNASSKVGEEMNKILQAVDEAGPEACASFVFYWYVATKNSSAQEEIISNNMVPPKKYRDQYYMPYRDMSKLDWKGRETAQSSIFSIWRKATEAKKKSPEPGPTPGPGPGPTPGPTPKPGLKGPGCKSGSNFIGLNGKTSGNEIYEVQKALSSAMYGNLQGRTKFVYEDKSDPFGTYGSATEEAVLDFQKTKGGKFAARIRNELGSSLGNPDGCVGPKTACALIIASSVQQVAGYDLAKCKAKFKRLNNGGTQLVQKGGKTPNQAPESQEQPQQQSVKAESKNWLDRTREDTTSSLFERLVQDVSKKKVL